MVLLKAEISNTENVIFILFSYNVLPYANEFSLFSSQYRHKFWISFLRELIRLSWRTKAWNFATSEAIGRKNFSNLRRAGLQQQRKEKRLKVNSFWPSFSVPTLSQGRSATLCCLSIIQWCSSRAFAWQQKTTGRTGCNFCHYLQTL